MELLEKNSLPYENTIIIGDNAIGKSEVIKHFVKSRAEKGEGIYYLDAVNRSFHVSRLNDGLKEVEFSNKITELRLKDENFNLVDTWAYYGTQTECIEIIYHLYQERVQNLLFEFLGNSFHVWMKETEEVQYRDGSVGKLSNGYQALVRLFLELIYAEKMKTDEKKVIVIDEVDEYLSPKNAGKLYPFLVKTFQDMRFIFATHSADFIAYAQNANIMLMKQEGFEILSSNDFSGIDDVVAMFKVAFGSSAAFSEKRQQDEELRMLLNNRISGIWGQEEENMLKAINTDTLSNAQKMIFKQIKEW